jgi:uncharacterized protein
MEESVVGPNIPDSGVPVGQPPATLHSPVFDTFLCKIASRCNLNCSYCYMYHLADQSWLRRPRFMSETTVGDFARRLAEYAIQLQLPRATVLLHGGEPLLAGKERLSAFVGRVKDEMSSAPSCRVEFAMQTNGTLLDRDWLRVLSDLDVTFGISLDGGRSANDRCRLDHAGASSYDRVREALDLVACTEEGRRQFRGLLAVIDLRNDPLETFEALRSLNPPRLDFLFPDATHDAQPFRPASGETSAAYGEWLVRIFDVWFENPGTTRMRLFENILDLVLGGHSQTEGVGEGRFNLLTIETDGEIEDVDIFKSAFHGAASLTILGHATPNVSTHSFYEVSRTPTARDRQRLHSNAGLCDVCRQCPVGRICGGGIASHRFSVTRGFDNPSVYCRDLYRLITHVGTRVGLSLQPLLAEGLVRFVGAYATGGSWK